MPEHDDFLEDEGKEDWLEDEEEEDEDDDDELDLDDYMLARLNETNEEQWDFVPPKGYGYDISGKVCKLPEPSGISQDAKLLLMILGIIVALTLFMTSCPSHI